MIHAQTKTISTQSAHNIIIQQNKNCSCVREMDRYTVNHLIIMASKLGYFKRLTYWRTLILGVSQINIPKRYHLFS